MMEEGTIIETSIDNPSTMPKPKLNSSECKICGAPSVRSHYGVVSCSSCKMFFKRNAELKRTTLKCDYQNHCDVNVDNRRTCSSCRLTKCFQCGMQTELLRSSRTKKNVTTRKTKITTQPPEVKTLVKPTEMEQPQHLCTLNLLESDQSTLNIDQWNCLSNLVHCYDEHSGLCLTENFLREQSSLPIKFRFKSAPVSEFMISLSSKAQLVFEKNDDFLSLLLHDRSVLLRRTMKFLTTLGGSFVARQTQLLDHQIFSETAEALLGCNTVARERRAIDQLDFDVTFIKLALSILSFSTVDCTAYTNTAPVNLKDTKTIVQIQDKYTELTWRYLLYKYDHHEAVVYFSKFIRFLLTLHATLFEMHDVKNFTDIIDCVIERTEQLLSLGGT